MYGAVSGPSSIGVDGTNPLEIRTDGSGGGSSSVGVTFGDPGGSTLLFDTLTSDYGSSDPPASCAHSSYSLVRQAPVQRSDVDSHPAGFYCAGTGISLLQPALRPDGQLIVASAQNDPSDPAPSPNPLASGQPRLVTMPLSGSAGASNPSPLNFITPDGLSAVNPDFSPDGSEIVFAGPDGIYVVPAAGGQATKVIDNATYPAWSSYTLPQSGPTPGPTPSPGPTGALRVSSNATAGQHVLTDKALIAHVECNVACAVAVVGAVATSKHNTCTTKQVITALRPNRGATVTLSLSHTGLRAIAKALRHHKHIVAVVGAVAQANGQRKRSTADFTVRH